MWKVIPMMFLASFLSFGTSVWGNALAQNLFLHANWEFSKYGSHEWLAAQVPGTVHQDLIAHDKLPDPFYGMNEKEIQWVENEDCPRIYIHGFHGCDIHTIRQQNVLQGIQGR